MFKAWRDHRIDIGVLPEDNVAVNTTIVLAKPKAFPDSPWKCSTNAPIIVVWTNKNAPSPYALGKQVILLML